MPKMEITELRSLLAAEKADALAAVTSSKLSNDRATALDYYNGDMSVDMPALPGRSSAVSSDVSDTIDGLMPGLMEVFCGGDEVVRFSPVGPEDIEQAEQESDYVNHVFMQLNPGFMILYTYVKDALLSKVGVIKAWTEEEDNEEEETYYGQPPEVLQAIVADPSIEVLAHNENPDGTHDVKIVKKTKKKCHKVENVPPEEYGIAKGAKNTRDATYQFHETMRTVFDLIEEGYDEAQVSTLPGITSDTESSSEARARDTVDESETTTHSGSMNKGAARVTVTEHYVRMDMDGKGKDCLYKIVTGGSEGDILTKGGKPDIEEVDYPPFAAMTPNPIPHRFFGKSMADEVMDIQRIKTALIRGMLDNLYKHNNPRPVVSKDYATENTIDDLLTHSHGAMIRVKGDTGAAIQWQVVPNITDSIYPALQYMDATREWRSGVTRQGQGIDADALQNQSATAVNQVMSATQARMKMIARIFAETGIRDLFSLLHAEIRKHGDKAETVRLRNQWVPVDPRQWKTRNDMTINVGLGSGNKSERVAHLMALIGLQKEALLAGKTNLVSDDKLFNSAKELAKLLDYKDPEQFFNDPTATDEQGQLKNPPPPPMPNPDMLKLQLEQQKMQQDGQMKQAEMQMKGQEFQAKATLDQQADERKAQIEAVQAQADIATQDRKMQAEMVMAQQKFEFEKELALLDHQLKREQLAADMEMKREAHQQSMQAGAFKAQMDAEGHSQKMEQAKAKPEPKEKPEKPAESKSESAMAAALGAVAAALEKSGGKRTIRKNGDGSYVSETD
jgi:hypothetical protein